MVGLVKLNEGLFKPCLGILVKLGNSHDVHTPRRPYVAGHRHAILGDPAHPIIADSRDDLPLLGVGHRADKSFLKGFHHLEWLGAVLARCPYAVELTGEARGAIM